MGVPSRRRFVVLIAATALAAPAPALGQSAGDEQYEDPFAGENQNQSQPEPTPTPAPAEPAPAPATTEDEPVAPAPAAQPAAQQPELPRTGLGAFPILGAGAVLLAGGIALRVRLRERS
jgi:hypothetical protein